MVRVKNEAVWRQTRILFLGSALLFLVNIYFGFDNALTVGGIPRWQALIHLHAGSLGWITLSVIGLAIWVFTGERDVTEWYARRVGALVWIGLAVFGGYIASFGLAFSQRGGAFVLLPIFGTSAMLVIWAAAVFAVSQLSRQPTVTTVHLLIAGALLAAAVGALMGVLLGLERVVGEFLPNLPPEDRVGVHAGTMDVYVLVAAMGLAEALIGKGAGERWTRAGMTQAVAATVAATLIPVGTLLALPEPVFVLFPVLLLVGVGIFLARIGRHALARLPLDASPRSWAFFGTIWLTIFVLVFLYAIFAILPDMTQLPPWFGAVFFHSSMVGMMTSLLLGLYSARTQIARHVLGWGEPVAMGLMHIGLPTFLLLKIFADTRLGAVIMGIGVLLGVGTMIVRLLSSEAGGGAQEAGTSTVGTT